MKEKKRFHLPLRAYLLYLFLISLMLTGITFSSYISSSYGSDEARVAKIGDLKITENGDFYTPGVFPVAPGADITKDICISFDGSETSCYAFLKLEQQGFERTSLTHYVYKDGDSEWLSFDLLLDGWTLFEEDGNTVVYYRELSPNEKLSEHIIADNGKISVNLGITASALKRLPDKLSLSVDAFAVQSGGFEGENEKECAAAAYKAVADR